MSQHLDSHPPARPGAAIGRAIALLVVAAAVVATVLVSAYWLKNRPKADRRRPPAEAALVEVVRCQTGDETITVGAMGEVTAARSIALAARVGGEVVEVSDKLSPGRRVAAGEMILRIEPTDYELQLKQSEDILTRARSELQIEMGQQAIARSEFELLGKDIDGAAGDLLLRKPQLAMARTAVAAAEARLAQAKLDLQRTRVTAPFNAVVLDHHVDLGSQVSPGAPLATLVGTDAYYIEASVPTDQLRWIDVSGDDGDGGGSKVKVYHPFAWGAEAHREGVVTRLLAELDPAGRMAKVLITVTDPLDLAGDPDKARPLLLGAYVRVEIEGAEVADVARVPRRALRDGDAVWVMDDAGALEIRPVEIVFSDAESVYIADGLDDGDRLIVSDLAAPAPSMALRTPKQTPDNDAPDDDEAADPLAERPRAAAEREGR